MKEMIADKPDARERIGLRPRVVAANDARYENEREAA